MRTYLGKEKLLPTMWYDFKESYSFCSALVNMTGDIIRPTDARKWIVKQVLEKQVDFEVKAYLSKIKLWPSPQFDFRKSYNCCSALDNMTDDMIRANDEKN